MNQGIYAITNIENNKTYIGNTVNFQRRWAYHRSLLYRDRHDNSHLQRAWNKYGENAFEFGVLEYLDDQEELHLAEQFWMDVYRLEGKGLYNYGLAARSGMLGRNHTEEAKIKIGKAHKNQCLSKEHKAKISKSLRNRKNKRKPLSKEDCTKMGARKAKPYPALRNRNTGEVIPAGINLRAMCREQSLCRPGIHKVITGQYRQHNGWELFQHSGRKET